MAEYFLRPAGGMSPQGTIGGVGIVVAYAGEFWHPAAKIAKQAKYRRSPTLVGATFRESCFSGGIRIGREKTQFNPARIKLVHHAPGQVGLRDGLNEIFRVFLQRIWFIAYSFEPNVHFDIWALDIHERPLQSS